MRREAGGSSEGRGDEGRRRGRRGDDGVGALEIEFEEDEASSGSGGAYVGRPRDLRATAMIALGVVVLGAALAATHHTGSSDTNTTDDAIVSMAAPDYAAYMVTVRYKDSHLVSLERRQLAVDMHITPVPGAQVSVLSYYVSENGVISHAHPVLAGKPLPASGTDVELDLTVNDCAVVPIGESMSFVNVVANGPAGVTDRFTILGERYSADLARLLRMVCPARDSSSAAGGAG